MFQAASVVALASGALAADWAVVVAGSNTYGNYRHQADACHAVQLLKKGGIPESNIITMMYDDIAESGSNPYKGKLFNEPTEKGTPGTDVYCTPDYKGKDVTPANFGYVLTGNSAKTGGKPVLQSTSEDNVFVNFVDHGGVGLIAFPSGTMKSDELITALKEAHSKNLYKKMVFYLEACESGSMFKSILPDNINIYATTAANEKESSWGTYCPPDDMVDGKNMETCLGDLYSVNWMHDTESSGPTETLEKQFENVVNSTSKSHVMQYGDLSWTSEPIGNYMGSSQATRAPESEATLERKYKSAVSSRDIPMHLAYYKYLRASSGDVRSVSTFELDVDARMEAGKALMEQVSKRLALDANMVALAEEVAMGDKQLSRALLTASPPAGVATTACVKALDAAFEQHCGAFDDYSLQFRRALVNMCNHVQQSDKMAAKITATIGRVCK